MNDKKEKIKRQEGKSQDVKFYLKKKSQKRSKKNDKTNRRNWA